MIQGPRFAAFILSTLALSSLDAGPSGSSSADVRVEKAKTLDDFHPWTPYTVPDAWRERAARLREEVLVSAGLWPMPLPAPLEPVIHGRIERDEYTVEKVFFESYPGFFVTGNLYRPRSSAAGPRPGVLFAHGHWRNGRFYEAPDAAARKEIDVGGEKTEAGAKYPLQAPCAMLARMGCVVFTYDMVGNADSQQIGHGQGFRDVEAELRLQSAFGLQTYNSIRALNFLSGLAGVDPKRIAVTGASGGGTQTFILCGVDDRPAVAFPAVMVSTAMQGGCVCENATLLRVGTGNIELAALTAPRPLGLTGANDWTIDIETKGLPELKALYASLGVPENVAGKCFPNFEHNYNQVSREIMYSWVNRHFKLDLPEPVVEKPFVPIPPAELSVFDAEHRLPDGAVDAAGLRNVLSESSDRQIAALVPRDAVTLAEHRRVVGTALRAILKSSVPGAGEVEARVEAAREVKYRDVPCREETLILTRTGTAEAVPALYVEPAGWKGTVVVAVFPAGKDGLSRPGEKGGLGGAAVALLEKGAAVLAPDVFLTGDLVPAGPDKSFPVDPKRHGDYAGYTFGYNRTPLANRAHDVLTAVGHARARPGTHTVHLLGVGEGGLWVILARGLAGDAVRRTLVDRPIFDFAGVKDVNDLRFLPGGVKYGGWGAFAALAAPGPLLLRGEGPVPPVLQAAYAAAGAASRLRQEPEDAPLAKSALWLLE